MKNSEPASRPLPLRAALLCVLLAVLFGGTPAAVRISTHALPPLFTAAVRFTIASAFMVPFCLIRKDRLLPAAGGWVWCGLLGVFMFAQIGLYHSGVAASNASHAALFINTFVFWAAAIEHFVTRDDRLDRVRWAGLACAAAGVVLVLFTAGGKRSVTEFDPAESPTVWGDLLVAASGFLLGAKIVTTKRFTRRVPPGTLILWHDVIGTACLFAASLTFEDWSALRLDAPAFWGLLYQGVAVGGFCFAAQTVLLEHHSASRVTAFNAASPVFGVLFAVLLLSDPVSPWLLPAAALVAAGIVLVNRRGG